MKNLFIIPTSQRSKLFFNHNKGFKKYQFSKEPFINGLTNTTNQNIYITSDEEIKEGDWFITTDTNEIHKSDWVKFHFDNGKKIILTTDQDLIKDGVQAIDDTFLEWFVKNPSCEEVEAVSISRCCGRCYVYDDLCVADKCCDYHNEYGCEICYGKRIVYKIIIPKEEPKQETLEEAAENHLQKWRLLNNIHLSNIIHAERCKNDFINGAKWQQERSYSKEEVLEMLRELEIECVINPRRTEIEEWFEQFKKK